MKLIENRTAYTKEPIAVLGRLLNQGLQTVLKIIV
jgi:hypothetical protein